MSHGQDLTIVSLWAGGLAKARGATGFGQRWQLEQVIGGDGREGGVTKQRMWRLGLGVGHLILSIEIEQLGLQLVSTKTEWCGANC